MQIYVHRNNQQLGPFTEDELKAQLASGSISLQDHAWWQGQTNWLPLSQTPFATKLAPGLPGVPGPNLGSAGTFPSSEKTSNLALWSLICGISSFLCGITFIPAIILGHMGLSETKKNPTLKGRGMAWAGLILGYGYLVLFIFIIVISVLIALGNQVKGTFKTLNAQAAQSQNSQDDSDSNQSTNSSDQSTNDAPATNSSDSSTNSTPAITP
jgi:Flp pilus assembly pilin Flp